MPGSSGGRKYKKEKRARMNLETITSELMIRFRNAGYQVDIPDDLVPAVEMLLANGIAPADQSLGLEFEPDYVMETTEPEIEVRESPDLDDLQTLGPDEEGAFNEAPMAIPETVVDPEMLQRWAAGNQRMLERVATSGVSYNGNGNPEVEGRTLVPDVDKSPRSMKQVVKPVAQAARAAAAAQQQPPKAAAPQQRPAQSQPRQGQPQARPAQGPPQQGGPRMTVGSIGQPVRRPVRPAAPEPEIEGAEPSSPGDQRRNPKTGLTIEQQRAIIAKSLGTRPPAPKAGRPNTIRGGR